MPPWPENHPKVPTLLHETFGVHSRLNSNTYLFNNLQSKRYTGHVRCLCELWNSQTYSRSELFFWKSFDLILVYLNSECFLWSVLYLGCTYKLHMLCLYSCAMHCLYWVIASIWEIFFCISWFIHRRKVYQIMKRVKGNF